MNDGHHGCKPKKPRQNPSPGTRRGDSRVYVSRGVRRSGIRSPAQSSSLGAKPSALRGLERCPGSRRGVWKRPCDGGLRGLRGPRAVNPTLVTKQAVQRRSAAGNAPTSFLGARFPAYPRRPGGRPPCSVLGQDFGNWLVLVPDFLGHRGQGQLAVMDVQAAGQPFVFPHGLRPPLVGDT